MRTELLAPPTYLKGFETLEEEVTLDSLPLEGELPAWLSGSLLRTGPAKFEVGEHSYRHWFDGLTMLHRFSFGDGAVSYGNRYYRGNTWKKGQETGAIPYPEFATDPCRSVFKRVSTMFSPEFGDNANINVVRLGERFLSMTEAPISVQFDPQTLESAGVSFKPPGMITTAHPHLNRATKGMLNFAVKVGARNEYRFFHLGPDSDQPEVTAKIKVKKPGYVHSFGLTERFIVFAEFPWVVNPIEIPLSGRPYAENYKWEPERGTRFFLVDRETGKAADPITTDPFFAFHHLNAYENDDGTIVADIQTYPDPSVVEQLYLDNVRGGIDLTPSEIRRFTIDPAAGTVEHEVMIDTPFELGRINYGRCNERRYRYAWGVAATPGNWIDRIVRADLEERSHTEWHESGRYPGEPVFVAEPGGTEEDDGVLLSVVLDGERETSFLLVLDAHDLSEVARCEVPHHIPFGFHGLYSSTV
ncbi:MAG: carotenoid oxygenase family protein [Thermoleophilaceae bacterium]|nr:carotenoid oxygenase family protein [Thermoleophilaceae bacterium]